MTTVHGLLVFFGFGLETTISSNMDLPPTGGSQTSGDVFASTGFVAGCGSGACCNTTAAPMIPRNHERRSDSKTGVRSYHNPHHQSKGESTKDLAAHQDQDEHGEESQTASQNGSRERLINGLVHEIGERFLAHQTAVLADAVKNHDRIVHRVSD